MAGQSPYDQFIDLNPPLINYLNVIPALLADLLHCPLTIAGIMVMAAVTALSVAVTALVLRLACQKLGLSFALLGAPVILSLAVFSAFLGIDYGQREHLIALLFFPFFFMRWLTWRLAASQSQSQSQSSSAGQHWLLKAFIGTAFGLALSLKPYVIIFPLLLELYWLVRYRTWRALLSIEMLTVCVVPLIYLAWSQFLFAGPGRENFYHFIVPLVLQNYCALNSLSVAMVNLFWLPTLLVLLIVLPATFLAPGWAEGPMALVLATSLSYVELQTFCLTTQYFCISLLPPPYLFCLLT
ncbi:MAG: hypothetical protein IPL73_02985 [Candidatus Obscuribacter sp.]|nr:hypothetical protein [Candidatus Obscuribacter sp.]